MALVFQYGSNTNTERLNGPDRLNGAARALERGVTVRKCSLVFDVWSKGNHCAAANIIHHPNRHVWGVLYEIPEHLLSRDTSGSARSLDAIEGEGISYRRELIDVRNDDGTTIAAWTYIGITNNPEIQTSLEYVRHILKGLTDHHVPSRYIEDVKATAIQNNPKLADHLMTEHSADYKTAAPTNRPEG